MLERLLDETDLGQLRDMVSPAFFDVIPTRVLWRHVRAAYEAAAGQARAEAA